MRKNIFYNETLDFFKSKSSLKQRNYSQKILENYYQQVVKNENFFTNSQEFFIDKNLLFNDYPTIKHGIFFSKKLGSPTQNLAYLDANLEQGKIPSLKFFFELYNANLKYNPDFLEEFRIKPGFGLLSKIIIFNSIFDFNQMKLIHDPNKKSREEIPFDFEEIKSLNKEKLKLKSYQLSYQEIIDFKLPKLTNFINHFKFCDDKEFIFYLKNFFIGTKEKAIILIFFYKNQIIIDFNHNFNYKGNYFYFREA